MGITLLAAGLAGCTPEEPLDPPTPAPSGSPVFASDEEALAAAEALYGEYLQAENALGAGGWQDLSLVEPFLRGAALEDEKETATSFSSKGYHQVGDITFDSTSLQSRDDGGSGSMSMTVYLCLDVAGADILNSSGESVVTADRPDRLALEVDIDDVEGQLEISRSEPWSGADFC